MSALALMTCSPLLSACARADEATQSAESELIYAAPGEPAMDAAMSEARLTLPVFWSKFDARPPGYDQFFVKVGLPTRSHDLEYIWVEVASRANGKFVGRLANEPADLKGRLKLGSKVEVNAADIADWSYSKDGKAYGHYTTRVLTDRASAEMRAETLALLAPTPLEAGDR